MRDLVALFFDLLVGPPEVAAATQDPEPDKETGPVLCDCGRCDEIPVPPPLAPRNPDLPLYGAR